MGNFDWNGFIDNLWERENAQGKKGIEGKGGYRNGKYYPYTTSNGNTDIGPGFDISHQSKEFKERAKKGFTKEELDSIVKDRLKDETYYFNQRITNEGGDTTHIPNNVYAGLLDMYWQLGNGLYQDYPKFWKAVAKGDYGKMREESKTYYDSKDRKKLDESRWNFRKEQYFNRTPRVKSIITSTFNFSEKPDALRVASPYPTQVGAIRTAPVMIPDKGSYIKAHPLTPDERLKEIIETRKHYNDLMRSTSIQSNPAPQFFPKKNTKAEGGNTNKISTWNDLSLADKAEMIGIAVKNGITTLPEIRAKYNEFAEGGYTVGELVDAIYANNPTEEYLGEPEHHYDFTESEEWANAHGYYPDARGHRDDRVKKPTHPSHPSRGRWDGDKFVLTDFGMQNPNYTIFGLTDGGQDPQAILTYNGGVVLPEVTVTPQSNYIFNPYDNIKLHIKAGGGSIHIDPSKRGTFTAAASKHGMGVQEFASKVLANKEDYSSAMVKKANFARNATKWKHGEGGNLFSGEDNHSQQMTTKSKQAPWYSELDEAVLGEVMQQVRNIAHPGNIEHASYRTDARGKKGGTAQRTYLLPRSEQEDIFLRDGYFKGKEGDYGLVKKAVHNRNLPVWQTAPDAVSRKTLVPIGNAYGMDSYGYINRDKDLVHAESHPATFYVDGSTGKLYTKGWDLNDYGGTGGGNSSKYNIFEKAGAKILDFVGNPVVVTTGFQEVTNPWGGPSEHLNRGATIQDLFGYDDDGYPVESNLGKLLDNAMSKKGLHREKVGGKWLYALPEVTVVGKRKKHGLGGNLLAGEGKTDKVHNGSINQPFLDATRKNGSKYGDNFIDLFHMYNNENPLSIFDLSGYNK